jgi:hypothetical protein
MKPTEALGREILELSTEDLNTVLDIALHEFRRRRSELSRKQAVLFRPGQCVAFAGEGSLRLPKGSVGRVRKVNQRSVSVDFGSYAGAWRVDAALLTLAPQLSGEDATRAGTFL